MFDRARDLNERVSRWRTATGERCSVVPMVVACIGVLVMVGLACALCVALVAAHRQAQSAADLAALAGAQALSRGREPCVVASAVARSNAAVLTECRSDATSVRVMVEVDGPGRGSARVGVRAEARAGWQEP